MNENTVKLKSPEEIKKMIEGGKKLLFVKKKLAKAIKAGVSAFDIEKLANSLINETGGKASFKMVKGYSWATCINVNEGVVHGIPKKEVIFKKGDVVSVDVGLYYQGFHTDTSLSLLVGRDRQKEHFLAVGRQALKKALARVKPGRKIRDISEAMESTLLAAGYQPIRALVGHGIGRELHEYPPVPCFVSGTKSEEVILEEGLVLAVEVMYTLGSSDVLLDRDGWTIITKDGKIAALFEETVAVTKQGHLVLTA